MAHTVSSIAEFLQGKVVGDGSVELLGFASADSAGTGDLTFAETEKYLSCADLSHSAAILVPETFTSATKTLILVPNVRVAMAKVLPLFFPPEVYPASIHSTAVIAETAHIDPTAHIGPHVVIGENVQIGARVALLGGNHIGAGSMIGEGSCLHPNVILYTHTKIGQRVTIHAGSVLGADGFGYTFDRGRHVKMPQVGQVIIGNDVEIGSNTSIDRGTLGPTSVGDGTKIDNFVHLAHNVKVGSHCVIMGQVGIAGSTTVGDYTVIASQTGIAGHLTIGSQVTIGAKSGLMHDVPDKSTILGVPAVPDKQAKRQWLAIQRLPALLQRLSKIEKNLPGGFAN